MRKLGSVLMALGLLLLCAAGALLGYNQHQAREAEAAARQLLAQLEQELQQPEQPTEAQPEPVLPVAPENLPEDRRPVEMATMELDGHTYLGELQIPELELTLPVLSDWSYDNLLLAPCRYFGNLGSGDLVIMAHNYKTHFGPVLRLQTGAEVRFRDVHNETTAFQVVSIETLQPNQVEEMNAGEFPLTLFTCAYGGQTRVALRCEPMEN